MRPYSPWAARGLDHTRFVVPRPEEPAHRHLQLAIEIAEYRGVAVKRSVEAEFRRLRAYVLCAA
jgi:hypothetical protein